jgi:hypothetical protein
MQSGDERQQRAFVVAIAAGVTATARARMTAVHGPTLTRDHS